MKWLFRLLQIALLIISAYLFFKIAPTGLSDKKTKFTVALEEDQKSAITRLKEENLIRSENAFRFFASIMKFPGNIEPGSYLLSHRMTTVQVANIMLNHPYQKWIILVPGLRVEQVAERLAKKFDWNSQKTEDFLENAEEGYMFPDTYLLNVDYSSADIARRLISNFHEHFDQELQNNLLAQNVRNDTAIKIASLIERESGSKEDKALIAGIIWNRLNSNMKLQIDATNQYILGTPEDWWPRVSGDDMKIDSLYNTYLYKGLPPTPICNPGLDAIVATVYPQETDCIFYLHDPFKNIHCSVTYEEHLENIERYLK